MLTVVKFELFELPYWLVLYELFISNIKFIKSKMQIIVCIATNISTSITVLILLT